MTAWTSMDDAWPEHKAEVLAWGRLPHEQKRRRFIAAFYLFPGSAPYWLIGVPFHGAREIVDVTHWMPLPEPPPPSLDPHSPEVIDAAQERIRRMSPEEALAFVTHRTPGIEETDRTGMLAGEEGEEE